jgi:hypothetical protein
MTRILHLLGKRLPHIQALATLPLMLLLLTGVVTGAHARQEADDQSYHEQERTTEDVGRQAFDAAILRPLGFVQTVASAVMLVVFYPAALATNTVDELTDICITQPVDQTFERPLGEL